MTLDDFRDFRGFSKDLLGFVLLGRFQGIFRFLRFEDFL